MAAVMTAYFLYTNLKINKNLKTCKKTIDFS